MLEKNILIYFVHLLLTEGIRAQSVGTGMHGDDVVINNPTSNSLATNIVNHNIVPGNPIQANSNIESIGLSNVMANGPNILEPIAASLAINGDADDLMRAARGTLIGNYGNPGLSPGNFMGNPLTLGLTGMGERVMLGAGVNDVSNTIGCVNQPIREFIADRPGAIRVPISPGSTVVVSPESIAHNLVHAAIPTNSATIPVGTGAVINNAINALNKEKNIANGPITTPVIGELSQVGVSNGLANPIALGSIANSLTNPAIITGRPTGTKVPTLASPVVANVPTPQEMFSNSLPTTLSGLNVADSKRILATLTGINPSSLGARTRFKVTSVSPIAPTGLKIQADKLLMEGKLTVSGKLPFLSSVSVDGVLPDGGKGSVMYECGNGNIGMVNEGPIPAALGPMAAGFGINAVSSGITNVPTNILDLRNYLY